jgi:tryptophan synthase beta chain
VKEQTGGLPDVLVACVGGGSNAIGLFGAFLDDACALVGVEAGGRSSEPGQHAARLALLAPGGASSHPPDPPGLHAGESRSARARGSGSAVGVLHGTRTYLLQDDAGNVLPTHSISAGLDYPAVGPEHAQLHDSGRVRYESVRDHEALEAFHLLAATEGILPALESSHALAWVSRAREALRGRTVLVNLSGRGDKDLAVVGGPA